MKRFVTSILAISLLVFALTTMAMSAELSQLEKKNTKYIKFINTQETASSTIEFWVTYYTPELWKLYNEKNKPAKTETTSVFLKGLMEEETVAFKVKIDNNASPIELNPISAMIKLRANNKYYTIENSDVELSYSFQGENEGFIYFPRHDKKTGADILKDAKEIWIELSPSISPVMQGRLESLRWKL